MPAAVALAILLPGRLHVLGRGVRLGWRFTAPAGLAGALAMLVGGLTGGLIASTFTSGDESIRDMVLLMAGGWIGSATVILLLLAARTIRPTRAQTGSHRRATLVGACLMGIVALAIFWPLTIAVNMLGALMHTWINGQPPSEIAHGLLQRLIDAGPTPWAWSMVALVAVVPPLLEEVLYRGLVQESLRRSSFGRARGVWRAIIATSMIFVVMHLGAVDVHALPGLFVLSMGFGWVSAKTGRLAASMTTHLLFNVGNLLLAVPWITG